MLARILKTPHFLRPVTLARHSTVAKPNVEPPKPPAYNPGTTYNGFVCKKVQYIADFNMNVFVFEHEKTGLQYMHLERQDSNNVFSINFRTTPFNSTGLPHILEHSVLCGSDKYPVRDPFFKMLNRSLATFMNAMTGPDYTLYPFSSTNEKDYRNLQSVYLDAAFRPNLKYLDFLQEGWRLENTDLNDPKSELYFKGVVYNEMKGAYSENGAIFYQNFFNKMLPDHTYGFNSGGDPLDIIKLTHQDLVDFHKKYYHPSNARIYSYGNFNLDKTMEYVNEAYLKSYDRIDSKYSEIPAQKRWTTPRKYHITSRYDTMGAPIEKQNQIAIGYLMADITDSYEVFVCHVLSELLVKGPNSYFYKSLIEPNISGGYNQMTGYNAHVKDTMFSVGLQDIGSDQFERVEAIFDATLNSVIEQGFDAALVESTLHSIELHLKHQTSNFGLGALFNMTPLWNHSNDLIESMRVSDNVRKLRTKLTKEPKYLQKKAEFYFKNNQHKLTVTMSPDVEYEKKFAAAEAENLRAKVEKLTAADRQRIFEEGKALLESQKSAVTNLEVLPCLKLTDIKSTIDELDLELRLAGEKGIPTQICTTNTNGVTYFRGILDTTALSGEQKMLLPLFMAVVDQFGTKKMDYRDFDKFVNSKTAGLGFSLHLANNANVTTKFELGVLFGSYCLQKNTKDMFGVFASLFENFEYANLERFEMLLENYMSSLAVGIADSGHLYAMQSCNGLVTELGQLREQLSGIDHILYMRRLRKDKSSAEILAEIQEIAGILFGKSVMRGAVNTSEADRSGAMAEYEAFLNNTDFVGGNGSWYNSNQLSPSCRHTIMNIPVNYCAKALPTNLSYQHADYAALKVMAKLLSAKYLLPTVREQNGAYGAGAKIQGDGIFNFYSYRDPNSRKTLDVFDNAARWVHDNVDKINDEQVLFEAKLGVLQQLDMPIAPKDQGMEQFRGGVTRKLFAKHRADVLNVTSEDLLRVTDKFIRDENKISAKCVLGSAKADVQGEQERWVKSKEL